MKKYTINILKGKKFFINRIQKRMLLSSILLTIFLLAGIYTLSSTLMKSLIINDYVENNANSIKQVEGYMESVFENGEQLVRQTFNSQLVSESLSEDVEIDNYAAIQKRYLKLDYEMGILYDFNHYIDSVILIGANNFFYVYDKNYTNLYLGNSLDFNRFFGENHLSVYMDTIGKPETFRAPEGVQSTFEEQLYDFLNQKFIYVRTLREGDNKVSGILVMVYNNSFIGDFYRTQKSQSSNYIFDKTGEPVWINSGQKSEQVSHIPFDKNQVMKKLEENNNSIAISKEDKRDILYHHMEIEEYDLFVINRALLSDIVPSNDKIIFLMILSFLGATLFSLITSYLLSGRICVSIHQLAQNINSDLNELFRNRVKQPEIFFGKFTIKQKTILFLLITVLVPCMIFMFLLTTNYMDMYRSRIISFTSGTMKEIKKNMDYKFTNIDDLSAQLIYNREFQSKILNTDENQIKLEELYYYENTFHNFKSYLGEVQFVSLYGVNGSRIFSTDYHGRNYDAIANEASQNAKNSDDGRMNLLYTGKDAYQNPSLVFSRNIRSLLDESYGKSIGYLIVSLDQRILNNSLEQVKFGNNGYFFIMLDDGSIVQHKNKYLSENVMSMQGVKEELDYKENGSTEVRVEGRNYLVFNEELEQFDFKIIGIIPSVDIDSKVMQITVYGFILLLIVFIVILFVSFFISIVITSPINKLKKLTEKVEKENFSVHMEYEGNDEIGILANYFNRMIVKINQLIEENYKSRIRENQLMLLEKEAKLMALQQQINPHFLYNTLDSIKWMAREKGAKEAADMATALAKLFRGSIAKDNAFVTINAELDILKSYLLIMGMRYADKLQINWDIDENLLEYKIPKLILQPIVENSLKHGMNENIIKSMLLTFKVYLADELLWIEVGDTGVGMPEEKLDNLLYRIEKGEDKKESSIGISNVFHRLKSYFGADCTFEIKSRKGEGTTVRVGIKLIKLDKLQK